MSVYEAQYEPRSSAGEALGVEAEKSFEHNVNCGLYHSSHWGDWTVNHYFFGVGAVDDEGRNVVRIYQGGGKEQDVVQGVRWSAEGISGDNEELAWRIWRNRGLISKAVAESLHIKNQGGGMLRGARLNIEFKDNTMRIYDWDWPGRVHGVVVDPLD